MMQALVNAGVLATCAENLPSGDAGQIRKGAMVWSDDTIQWVGAEADLKRIYPNLPPAQTIDAQGHLVIPGLIDCHTHLAFGGWRAAEFAMRCRGATYQEIARQGGGILSTVAATRQADEEVLREKARGFLEEMCLLGVTTVECKSGYGLTLQDELKLLRVYRDLAQQGPQRIVATLLGAHAVPPEYQQQRGAFVDLVCDELIPNAAGQQLAEFCDVFVEQGAFTLAEARRILLAGQRCGLGAKLHVDQLHQGHGAELAAELCAVSADHLEHTSRAGIAALARAGVVAVALPLASLYLGQPAMQARRFLDQGVCVALATDFNPGTAPSYHLPLTITLGCTMNGLTPAEALRGTTICAAKALAREQQVGSLQAGKKADFLVVDAPSVDHLAYQFRANPVLATFIGGQRVAGGLP